VAMMAVAVAAAPVPLVMPAMTRVSANPAKAAQVLILPDAVMAISSFSVIWIS